MALKILSWIFKHHPCDRIGRLDPTPNRGIALGVHLSAVKLDCEIARCPGYVLAFASDNSGTRSARSDASLHDWLQRAPMRGGTVGSQSAFTIKLNFRDGSTYSNKVSDPKIGIVFLRVTPCGRRSCVSQIRRDCRKT
jgi:hypothetical protein